MNSVGSDLRVGASRLDSKAIGVPERGRGKPPETYDMRRGRGEHGRMDSCGVFEEKQWDSREMTRLSLGVERTMSASRDTL